MTIVYDNPLSPFVGAIIEPTSPDAWVEAQVLSVDDETVYTMVFDAYGNHWCEEWDAMEFTFAIGEGKWRVIHDELV